MRSWLGARHHNKQQRGRSPPAFRKAVLASSPSDLVPWYVPATASSNLPIFIGVPNKVTLEV